MSRIYNFSAGPATLPEEVLKQAQADLVDYQGEGMSIMEMSHRGKVYDSVHQEAKASLKQLLNVPDNYKILFLQGGATMQFGMIPMNLMAAGQTADYALTGAWGKKAIKEAQKLGSVSLACDTLAAPNATVPSADELNLTEGAAYFHLTSNETISGNQFKTFPKVDAPMICDMSSDILSRPLDVSEFGLIYAGAQKNMGPSGVAAIIIREDLLERCPANIPEMLNYKVHADNDSMFNTPPTFSIYMLSLTFKWLLNNGGVEAMSEINDRKSGALYTAIDTSEFYRGTTDPACRSTMNVCFRLPTEELEAEFIKVALANGMSGLKGHRSVGGIRASIYNAFPEQGVNDFIAFMKEFENNNG